MAVEAREYLQLIEDAVRHMELMVDALLKMAVLRRQALRLSHSELNPIVDEVISMLQPNCNGRDVEWRIAKLPALDCDPILMTQVFQNLLGNALKYSRGRAKAVIEVDSIQQPGKPAIILVRDNGAGFNMKYGEKLFGVLQRFHTDAQFEGSGVGLATVYRIIQKHGGDDLGRGGARSRSHLLFRSANFRAKRDGTDDINEPNQRQPCSAHATGIDVGAISVRPGQIGRSF